MDGFTLSGQKVTILGWARSGQSAAKLAESLGAEVFVSESRSEEELDEASLQQLRKYDYEAGGNSKRILDSDLIILSPGIPLSHPILKNYSGKIWSELELAWRAMPCRVIAITGTNGKTTTTTLIGEILVNGYEKGKVFTAGNIGKAASSAALHAAKDDICVLEVSSFQLETIEKFRPDAAVFLNLRSDHLDRYADMNEYTAAKLRIFMNMTENDTAILNIDDAFTRNLIENETYFASKKIRTVTVSAKKTADYNLTDEYTSEMLGAVKAPENLLSAVAAALLFGVEKKKILDALGKFKGLAHRIERIGNIKGVVFFDDSKATNVHSVEAALNHLDAPIVLIMGGKDKNEDYRSIKSLVDKKCRALVSYGEAAKRISNVLGGEIVIPFDDAVKRAYELAEPDAALLLSPACSSYDQFKDYTERGNRFRKIYNDLLEKLR